MGSKTFYGPTQAPVSNHCQEKGCNLYIILSSTPLKMGRFIRVVTHSKYNHVSVCTDEKLEHFYSFSRYYKNAPLYGGFTEESALRYQLCQLKIFKFPITREQLEQIEEHISSMKRSEKVYIYNTLSAVAAMFHVKIKIPYAYTCAEFATDVLVRCCGFNANLRKFYSINRLEKILEQTEGVETVCISAPEGGSWGNDLFPERKSAAFSVRKTCKNLAVLFFRYAKR